MDRLTQGERKKRREEERAKEGGYSWETEKEDFEVDFEVFVWGSSYLFT